VGVVVDRLLHDDYEEGRGFRGRVAAKEGLRGKAG
jgi:hypothetical protein